jgi:ribonuclease BN (tRNA processing enzyme)
MIPIEIEEHADFYGFSRSGLATTIVYKPANILFDIGTCTPLNISTQIDTIFISHSHLDHISGLIQFISLRKQLSPNAGTLQIFIPQESYAEIHKLLSLLVTLDNHPELLSHVKLVPVEKSNRAGKLLWSSSANKPMVHVLAFDVRHTVPSVGYNVFATRDIS